MKRVSTSLPADWGLVSIFQLTFAPADCPPACVHLVQFELAGFTTDAYSACQIVFPRDLQRSVVKRQAEFFFGRLAARLALNAYACGSCVVSSGGFREPVWPPGIVGSITHNQRFAAAVALERTLCAGVGIDIESVISEETQSDVIAQVLEPGELSYLHGLASVTSLRTLLTIAFSVKESFFKAAFGQVRAYFDFDALRLIRLEPDARRITLELQITLSAGLTKAMLVHGEYALIDEETVCTCCYLPAIHASGS